MKASKTIFFVAFWMMLIIWGIFGGLYVESSFYPNKFGRDLKMRRNETLCAYQGVNSYRIWNREVSLAGFVPWGRPDMPNVVPMPGDKFVHAYPAWHSIFFWFYGLLPEVMCLCLMSFCYGICLKYIVDEIRFFAMSHTDVAASEGCIVVGFVSALIAFPVAQCFYALNYGIFLAAVFVLLRKFNNSNNQLCAGLCWAVMMIKPQVGALFFWPLFWQKKYRTILTAICVCSFACFLVAAWEGENPIELVFQIPQIGKPYDGYFVVDAFLKPVFGDLSALFWMGGFFALAGIISFLLKGVRDLLVSAAPISVFIPLWTYSWEHDHVILLGWFLAVAVCAIRSKFWRAYCCGLIFMMIFKHGWSFAWCLGIFDPAGIGWIYRLFVEGFNVMTVFAAILFSVGIFKSRLPNLG